MSVVATGNPLPNGDALSSYGLEANPFSESVESHEPASTNGHTTSFFMGGDRRAVLDEVSHLCQFSNNVVAVLGEAGVGKTALVYQAMAELGGTSQCCLVRSSVMVSPNDILRQLALQLGVFIPDEIVDIETTVSLLGQYQTSGVHQRVVIVVDDAHHLNVNVLTSLILLLQQPSVCSFHILLVGDSSLLPRLDQLDKGDILAYDIPLCPFTVDELAGYLAFKLSAVGYQGAELFDYAVVEGLWRDTRGIPASVNKAASSLLLNKALNSDDGRRLGLPIAYMVLLVVLLAALIMAVFYVGDEQSAEEFEAPVVQNLESTLPAIDPIAENEDTKNIRLTDDQEVDSSPSSLPGPSLDTPGPDVSNAVDAALADGSVSASNFSPSDNLAEVAISDEVSRADNQVEAIVPEPSVLPVTSVELLAPALAPAEPTVLTPSPDAVASTNVQSDTKPEVSPNVTVSAELILLATDEQAVIVWPAEAYTLQVMAASQLSGVNTFVQSQSNRNLLRVVRFSRNDSPWYAVLVGIYADISSARAAISSLPQAQVVAQPWPRKIGDVQEKIAEFRRK